MSLASQILSAFERVGAEIKAMKARPRALMIAASDETTPLTTGIKTTFRLPHAMTLTNVRASLTTASTGSSVVVDVRANDISIFSTKASVAAGSKSGIGVLMIAPLNLADDDEITVWIDQPGTAATGLKVTLIGRV